VAPAAAFFDLDRTLISRSSALALAGAFRSRGIIRRRDLLRAALWQLRFAGRGAGVEATKRMTEGGMVVLRGLAPDDLRELVEEALEPTLLPLVYREALELVHGHRERGERTYIVTATLQEIADALAARLGFDGALGSLAEIVDGSYTGRPVRALHADAKADALRELDVDLVASTAYSDSISDPPLLEAVGNAVAVNPDRELRRVALERGWPTLRFSVRAIVPAQPGADAAGLLLANADVPSAKPDA
jgi:HAD superfamily hydrolase (TIGR01490 family)